MKKRSKPAKDRNELRDKIIGLGDKSIRKSYYPELQARLAELEVANHRLRLEIDERRKAEEALTESEEKYRTLVTRSPDGIFIVDLEGRFVSANEAMYAGLGYSEHEMLSLTVKDVFQGNHLELSSDKLTEKFEIKHQKEPVEYTSIGKHGKVHHLEILFSLYYNSGRLIGLQGIARDITDRKKSEEEKAKLQTQLQQAHKMEALGILAGGVAHDFNNLLQAIMGYAELLLMDEAAARSGEEFLQGILSASGRAAQLVRQLLLFGRRAPIKKTPFDLNDGVEQARRILERTIPKMIDIELHLGRHLWTVNADPMQIEQILLNLGNNAADAMPDGGQIIVKTENVSVDENLSRQLSGVGPGNYVLLTVSDTGTGMDPENLEHIFEPFYTTKGIGKGTGLGLASVYGIVESHGGYIFCRSQVGKGTIFEIYIPAIESIHRITEAVSQKPVLQGGRETVLIVDDEASIRDFASQTLQRFGYTVYVAASGEEALEIFSDKNTRIDLVILDLGMPGMGGYKCLRVMLKQDPSAKAVIASGYSGDGQVNKALESGAVGFIGKPYLIEELLTTIRTVLDEKR